MAASMPRTLGGLCRGARPKRDLKVSIVSGVILTDLVNFSPPWTTRWPTAEISLRSSISPIFGSSSVSMMSLMASRWLAHSWSNLIGSRPRPDCWM